MMCFRNLFLLTVITISFAEESTPAAAVAKEPTPAVAEAAPALVPDTVGAPTKPVTEPAVSPAKVETPEAVKSLDAASPDAKKEAPALEAPGGGLMGDEKALETPSDSSSGGRAVAEPIKEDEAAPASEGVAPVLEAANVEDDVVAMTHMWHLAALLSFVGIAAYSFVFLCKVFPSSKSYLPMKSSGAMVSSCQDDLDCDDVELAMPVPTTPSPASRKKCGTVAVFEEAQVLPKPKEDALDGGWGDNSWGSQDWDDLDDCEAELDTISSSISSVSLPQAPAPVKKRGKSD